MRTQLRKNSKIKVGNLIEWNDVPDNTIVYVNGDYGIRRGNKGHKIGSNYLVNWRDAGSYVKDGKAKIIVLNVPLNSTKEEMIELIRNFNI